MFSGLADQLMVMRAALAPVRLTKWQIAKLVVKQIYRQISLLQVALLLSNLISLLYTLCLVLYRLFFHPLSRYPGPRLAAVSDAWYFYHSLAGRYPFVLEELHKEYGPVVRIRPNELSFATPRSYLEIYGDAARRKVAFEPTRSSHGGRRSFKRLPPHRSVGFKPSSGIEAIIAANANGFVSRLSADYGRVVNLQEWFSFLTLDMAGAMILGYSFGAVKQGVSHRWIDALNDSTSIRSSLRWLLSAQSDSTLLSQALGYLLFKPSSDVQAFQRDCAEHVRRGAPTAKSSGVTGLPAVIPSAQSVSSRAGDLGAADLVVAAAQPMAFFLTVTTRHLLANSEVLRKVTEEVRAAFPAPASGNDGASPQAIDMPDAALQSLPYLCAVVEEGLRILPWSALGARRRSAVPTRVADTHPVPSGVDVSTCNVAIHHSVASFAQPAVFAPDRWLSTEDDGYGDDDNLAASTPFGIGLDGACPGLDIAYVEARAVLARLLRAFDLEDADEGATATGAWEDRIVWRGGGWRLPPLHVGLVLATTAFSEGGNEKQNNDGIAEGSDSGELL